MKAAIWTGMYAEKPLDEAIRILHGQGWNAFEVSTEHLVALEESDNADTTISKTLDEMALFDGASPQSHGLLQADVAASEERKRETDINRICRHIEISSLLGVEIIVLHPGGRTAAETRAERDRILSCNIEAFRGIAANAAEHDMKIGLENLTRRGVSTSYEMLELLDAIGCDNIGITLDTSHANVVGLSIPAMIAELGSALVATHISDNDGSGDQHRTPGNGRIEWPPIAKALGAIQYQRLFNLEIPGERHADYQLRDLKSRHAVDVTRWLMNDS